jgi:RHS repeat-associated protein
MTEVDHYTSYANYAAGTSNQIVRYKYDAFNHVIERILDADGSAGTGNIAKTVYAYDGDQIALQFDTTYANGSTNTSVAGSNLSHRYLWNSQAVDQLFADEKVTSPSTAGNVLWALTDHENTIRDLATYNAGTNTTAVANHRAFDSYGNLESESTSDQLYDCLFGYTGRMYDEATGLQNNQNRWYDSKTGRWMSKDPIGFAGGDANLFRYVGNNPLGDRDPSGLSVWERIGGTLQGVAGVLEAVLGAAVAGVGTVSEGGTIGASTPVSVPMMVGGAVLAANGVDNAATGFRRMWTGESQTTLTSDLIAGAGEAAGLDSATARTVGDSTDTAIGVVGGGLGAKAVQLRALEGSEAANGVRVPKQRLCPLRQRYVDAVKKLAEKVPGMRKSGMSSEEIARALHAERRALGVQYKDLTPPGLLEEIYQRNLERYGDKLGPTIDWLRSRGKTWEDIIESASRSGGSDLGF